MLNKVSYELESSAKVVNQLYIYMIYTVEASHCQLSCCGELNTKKRKFLVPLPKTREICSAFAFLVFSIDVLKLAIQSQLVRYNYKDLFLKLTTQSKQQCHLSHCI